MDHDTLHSPVAITYAQALLELASEQHDTPGSAELVGQELADLRRLMVEQPLAISVLIDPAISQEDRYQLLERVFQGRISALLLKFLHVLAEKNRLALLRSIAGAYQLLLDERHGKIEVDVTVATRLDDQTLENVRQRIGAALKRDVVLHQYVDETILGGLVLRVQDKLIDGSVRAQLVAMRERIVAARPN